MRGPVVFVYVHKGTVVFTSAYNGPPCIDQTFNSSEVIIVRR